MPQTGSFTAVVLFIIITPSFVNFGPIVAQMLIGRFQQLMLQCWLRREIVAKMESAQSWTGLNWRSIRECANDTSCWSLLVHPEMGPVPVSYTHLTLPTNREV